MEIANHDEDEDKELTDVEDVLEELLIHAEDVINTNTAKMNKTIKYSGLTLLNKSIRSISHCL